jgi:hypothetical protein
MNLTVLRGMTKLFIAQDPIKLDLIPTVITQTPSGGQIKEDGDPRPTQTFKLIAMSYTQRPTVTVSGKERIIDYTLLGEWDAEVAVGDHWVGEDNKLYEVLFMVPGYGYETKAWVECHG